LGYVKKSGGQGVFADEISKTLNVPRTDTYSTLRDLAQLGYIFTYSKERRGRGERRRRRYVAERVVWKKYGIEDKIAYSLRKNEAVTELVEGVKEYLFNGLLNVYESLSREFKELLPSPSKERFCPKCGVSHEALEFFHVIVLASLSEALDEDDFYTDLLGVLGYTRHPTHDTHSTKRPSPHRNMIR